MDINKIDQWIIGNYWVASQINQLNEKLSIDIGPRWATSENERKAADFIKSYWDDCGLTTNHEEFSIKTYEFNSCKLEINGKEIDSKPYHRCPSTNLNNYLIITKKQILRFNNQFILSQLPIKIFKMVENLNIEFLKHQFIEQSQVIINNYTIDINAREMSSKNIKLIV